MHGYNNKSSFVEILTRCSCTTWIWRFLSCCFDWLDYLCTGKSLSEALPFAEHRENMLCTKIVLNVRNNFYTQHVLPWFELEIFMYWTCNSMNNLSSYCGLVDAKIRASDKDLPVQNCHTYYGTFVLCLVWVLPSSFTFLWSIKHHNSCDSFKDIFTGYSCLFTGITSWQTKNVSSLILFFYLMKVCLLTYVISAAQLKTW